MSSGRLPSDVGVKSRLFPKIRSWVALGAPLELLSPLSLVRVLYAVLVAAWVAEAALPIWPGSARVVVLAAAGVGTGIGVALWRAARLGPVGCAALLTTATVLDLVVAAVSPRVAVGMVPLALVLLPAVTVAFFYRGRGVAGHQALVSAGLLAATARLTPLGAAVALSAAWSVSILAASLVVQVSMAAVGRSGTTDPETGLPNSLGLIRRVDATPSAVSVVVLRLAGVDEARQALGHHVGAELLRRAVEDLGQVVAADALIGRLGGDELVVVQGQPVEVGAAAAEVLAGELAAAVCAGRYLIGDIEVSLRAHGGVISSGGDGPGAAELIRRASLAARTAAGSGVVCLPWDGSDGSFTAEDLTLLAELRTAIERDELHLAYQPQRSVATGEVVSVEALLRWVSPALGAVPPGRFIPLAEQTGLIERITRWVLAEALDAQVRWRAKGVACPVAVNLSPRILGVPHLATSILDALRGRGLPADALTVEVTETAALDLLDAIQLLRPLHEGGVRVSIDDFGTGYTSLAAIPYLPLDELKVDMGFVRRSVESATDRAIVSSVRELTRQLGLTSVAEGVETEEIEAAMSELGFDLLQGMRIGAPMPEADLLGFLGDLALLPGVAPAAVRP